MATVAATASSPSSAALGVVVSAGAESMTGQGQAVPGSSAWSAVFRHVRYENLVAGVSGGVLSNLALHPLDLVKIRFAGKSPFRPWAPLCCHPGLRDKGSKRGLGLPCFFRTKRRALKKALSIWPHLELDLRQRSLVKGSCRRSPCSPGLKDGVEKPSLV